MPQDPTQTAQSDPTQGVPDVKQSMKERIMGGIGAGMSGAAGMQFQGSPLDDAINKHHQKRLDEARMHRKNYATYSGVIATGRNPDTGEKLTPEETKQYENWRDAAWGAYEKAAGVSPDIKKTLQKHKAVTDAMVKHVQDQSQQQGQGPTQGQDQEQGGSGGGQEQPSGMGGEPTGGPGLPAPPKAASPAAVGGSPEASAPSGGSLPPPPQTGYPRASADVPRLQQEMDQRSADDRKRKQEQDTADINVKAERAIKETRPEDIQERKANAKEIGLEPGSPDYIYYLATGTMSAGVYGAGHAPKRVTYSGPDGAPLFGFQVGTKLYDQEMNPLPDDTQAFSAGLVPKTTTSTKESINPVTGEKHNLSSTSTRKPVLGGKGKDSGAGAGSGATSKSGLPAPPSRKGASSANAKSGGKSDADQRREDAYFVKSHPEIKKSFDTYNLSQERFGIMQNAYKDAIKGDQQAMLNLLANHLGMTMGLQRGARITQTILDEAVQSRPWLKGIQAKFGADGYLSGVTLDPTQMYQMLKLGKDRLSEDKDAYDRQKTEARSNYGLSAPPSSSKPKKDPLGLY